MTTDAVLELEGAKAPVVRSQWLIELARVALLFLAIVSAWLLALQFVHPGYIDPFWPSHSDIYGWVASAQSGAAFSDVTAGTRPTSGLLLPLLAKWGVQPLMVGLNAIVFCNIAVAAMFARRLLAIDFNAPFVAAVFVYALAIFSGPHQYTFSTFDCTAQLSFLFLAAGGLFAAHRAPVWLVFMALLLGCLAKETFYASLLGASLAFVVFTTWFTSGDNNVYVRRVAVASLGAVVIGLIAGQVSQSVFTGAGDYAGSPYQIVVAPLSVMREWLRYAGTALRFGDVIVLAGALLALFLTGGWRWLAFGVGAVGAGAAAWLPNSIFPNHFYAGYSCQGAYLLFLPIVALAAAVRGSAVLKGLAALVCAIAVAAPMLDKGRFAGAAWELQQKERQRRVILATREYIEALPAAPRRVLVSGLNFPFSPFDHPAALRSLGLPSDVTLDVVVYVPRDAASSAPKTVRYVAPQSVTLEPYDEIWAFAPDGAAVDPKLVAPWVAQVLAVDTKALFLYPALIKLARGAAPLASTADWLNCGGELITYNELALAEMCLRASIRAHAQNPYAYYYLGNVLEKGERTAEAREAYASAVAFDDPANRNAGFAEALARTTP